MTLVALWPLLVFGCAWGSESDQGNDVEKAYVAIVELNRETLNGSDKVVYLSVVKTLSGCVDDKSFPVSRNLLIEGVAYYLLIFDGLDCGRDVVAKSNLIPLYDVAYDRYSHLREFLKENELDFYVEDFSVDRLWLPKSCENSDLSACKDELKIFNKYWVH